MTWKGVVMQRKLTLLALAAALVLGSSAQLAQAQGMAKETTLYQRLGGKNAIKAVVDDFVGRVAADSRINAFFAATAADPKRLAGVKSKLVDQICEASGGPCKYIAKRMKPAHACMRISGADFGALVSDLVAALDKFNVQPKDKDA